MESLRPITRIRVNSRYIFLSTHGEAGPRCLICNRLLLGKRRCAPMPGLRYEHRYAQEQHSHSDESGGGTALPDQTAHDQDQRDANKDIVRVNHGTPINQADEIREAKT